MPVVFLVRHSQASFGASDYDALSDLGHRQAEVIGTELARRTTRLAEVRCGTLRRQRDTASGALAAAGWAEAVPVIDGRWDEYDHVALLERYPPDVPEMPQDSRGVQRLLDAALLEWIAGGDAGGWTSFSGGAVAALEELVAGLGRGEDAAVFTSAGVIAAVCGALLGLPPAGVVALNRVGANGAITKLITGRSGIHLSSFNDHSHFEGERREMLTLR